MRDWLGQQRSQSEDTMSMGGMMHGGRCTH
jgi:hypothetical protein